MKNVFSKKLKIMICLFYQNGKMLFWKWPWNQLLYPTLTIRCQKVKSGLPALFSKLLANLTGWKTEYLSTWLLSSGQEFDEKFLESKHVLNFKVYFQPSRKKKYFVFLPLPILPVRLKILHLNWDVSVLPVLNSSFGIHKKMFCFNLNPFYRIFFNLLFPSIQNCTIVSNAITFSITDSMNFLKSFDFFIFTFICTVTKLFAVSTKLPDLPSLTSHSGVTNRGNNIIRLWHSWKIEKKNEMIRIHKYAVQVVEPIQNKSKKVFWMLKIPVLYTVGL